MKEFLLTATYLVGAGELFLAWYFWKTNSGNEIRRVMVVLSFAMAAWTIANGLSRFFPWFGLIAWVAGTILVTAIVHLALVFPYRVRVIDAWHVAGLYFPASLFSYLLLFTNTVVGSTGFKSEAAFSAQGPLFVEMNVFLGVMFSIGVLIMFMRIQKMDGIFYRNLKLVAWSLLLGGLPGVLFAVFHFWPDLPYNDLYGPLGTSVWVGVTSYILLKK